MSQTKAQLLDGKSATIQFTGGSASAPSVSFTGDTNTGIYSPGADQVAISTGGSGKLFVDASGNVGVSATPTALGTSVRTLEIKGAATNRSGGLSLTSSDNSANAFFYTFDNVSYLGTTATPLSFFTNNTERLRITSAGLVGIGTSTARAGLTVALGSASIPSAGAATGSAVFSNGSDSGVYGLVVGANTSGVGYIQSQRTDGTATTYDLAIQPNGSRVGIGTTSPGATLNVIGNAWFQDSASSGAIVNIRGLSDKALVDTNTYGAAMPLVFGISGTERARIDSSGRLLVGTSTARSNFFNSNITAACQIEGTGSTSSASRGSISIVNNNTDANQTSYLILGKSNGSGLGSNTIVTSDTYLGIISFQGADGSEFVDGASIHAQVDGTPGANDLPTRLVFSTTADGASSPTERMRISSTGKTNITAAAGVSEPAIVWENTVNSSGTFGSVSFLGSNCNNTSSYHYIANTGLADKYYIYGNGTTGTPSDINLKKNIETTRDGYLEDLCRLRVVKYNWNEQTDDEPKELGVIAQELEQVFPGLVQQGPEKEDGSSYKAVKTSVLPFMLLKALQEAVAKIEILEAKVAVLESV